MKHQQHFQKQRGMARWKLITLIVYIAGTTLWLIVQSMPSKAVRRQQATFLQGIESRNGAKVSKVVSEKYVDRWKFNRDDLVATTMDVGSQFLVLVVRSEEVSFDRSGKTATVKMKLSLGGKPLGVFGNEVTRRVNSLKEPFTFIWKKEGFLPSSWRLVKMDNPEIPTDIYGYTPGSIREMMEDQ